MLSNGKSFWTLSLQTFEEIVFEAGNLKTKKKRSNIRINSILFEKVLSRTFAILLPRLAFWRTFNGFATASRRQKRSREAVLDSEVMNHH